MSKKVTERTSQGLRDILFDELTSLRLGKSEPNQSMAVANIAKQIINTAKVELDFHRTMQGLSEKGREVELGALRLGS